MAYKCVYERQLEELATNQDLQLNLWAALKHLVDNALCPEWVDKDALGGMIMGLEPTEASAQIKSLNLKGE